MKTIKLTPDLTAAVHGLRSFLADGHNCGNHHCESIPDDVQEVVEGVMLLSPQWAHARTNIDTRIARMRLLANASYRAMFKFCSKSPTLGPLMILDPDHGFDDQIDEIQELVPQIMNAITELTPRENNDERTPATMITMNTLALFSILNAAQRFAAVGNADEIDYLITEGMIYALDSYRWYYNDKWENLEDHELPDGENEDEAYARFMHTNLIDKVAVSILESFSVVFVEATGHFRERSRNDLN